ncbi:conserved hypothetical protein [Coccidioides posadasii str. Silveira]|uniref:Protein kinase domain-containing protein n=1 Tax=Coccidioides posadasii (strain RMSCC 757 / Silveira) TaxID=443226 RepID=E9CSS4_COCPS|nr:conserved hypothetical protein [Coccidioides posadasii str. Silveira]
MNTHPVPSSWNTSQTLRCSVNNYTQARMNKFLEGIREIHKALVEHGDPKPRNMLIVKDDPERVVWIDFNRANTYDEHRITDRERAFLDEEEETVEGLKMCLPTFQKGDSNKRTYSTVHDVSHLSSSPMCHPIYPARNRQPEPEQCLRQLGRRLCCEQK